VGYHRTLKAQNEESNWMKLICNTWQDRASQVHAVCVRLGENCEVCPRKYAAPLI
jgi:hypothetical protein